MVEESRAVRTRQTLDALDERTRVQQIRSVALSGIQGKPLGPVASNVLLESDAKLYRAPKVEGGGEGQSIWGGPRPFRR